MLKKRIFFLVITACYLTAAESDFNSRWQAMQEYYQACQSQLPNFTKNYDKLVHPDWQKKCRTLAPHIMGAPKKDFLLHPTLRYSMIRAMSDREQIETDYITNKAKSSTRDILMRYKDSEIGGVAITNSRLSTTSNSTGQLYYLARILDHAQHEITSIVEFGGGYGNLARIAMSCLPNCTYFILDLPEICAIQNIYLNSALPGKVKSHSTLPESFEPGFVHIIPAYLLEHLSLSVDLFASLFAITESSLYSQQVVQQKNFFNARECYVVGLNNSEKWVSYKPLLEAIKSSFRSFILGRHLNNSHMNEMVGLR